MKAFFTRFLELIKDKNTAAIGAGTGFALAVLLVVFGFLKTLFILLMTFIGFYIGAKLLSDKDKLKDLLDKILPPGRFR
ncbi:MAG: DUF2273 domain-containing protein [Clostridiaceae bacterium]|nr:DUF2273 domain-containing protein [Clostridiaceae bacterium]